ncbi:MAG TPA: HAD-IA family hydrolase [Nitriliruptorales bacterium]
MPLRAVIFDFDGLLVDTEQPSYEAWCEPFAQCGVELALERWLQVVGTHDAVWDPLTELEQLTGQRVDREALTASTEARFRQLADRQPCRPGVLALLDEVRDAGLPVAVASSSRHTWVESHLARLGLRDRFDAVIGRDLVGWRGKPDPAVYLEALRHLGVAGSEAIALEDSTNGVRSAVAAGIPVVAVPNAITRGLEFEHALAVLDSLENVTLADLVELASPRRRAETDQM